MSEGIQEKIKAWDGEAVVSRFDAETESWVFIALHDSTLGPLVGGCRMRTYPGPEAALDDAMRLAEGMTYKWAAVEYPFGGGKSVLAVPRRLESEPRIGLLRRFGDLLATLRGTYMTGVDLGTTPDDMRAVAERCDYVMGVSADGATSLDPGPYTALGVFVGVRSGLRAALGEDDLAGRSVLVQGVGDVGKPLAELLAQAGAKLLVCDTDAARAESVAERSGGSVVPAAEAYETECDVFSPCAVGAVLNPETIPRLRCRVVAGSANNQLRSSEDADRLHARGILYAPDYVVNAGGAIAFGLMHRGLRDKEELRHRVRGIQSSLDEIFAEAAGRSESPARAARRRAERILETHRSS